MGIFEKSIPKYVVNPINQDVQIAPQDVYVDDLFDPLFNTNVRRAMEAKYGGGLYGIAGGYSELLKNTWGGEGPLGKGMGLLSTFGRTMEKADDLVLGLTTEAVEGLTGQGFDDPFVNIFANDQDYSGKRLLASVANIGRNLAGTTVTEDDLGTAWNLPGLGIDLATDVGILGGSVARKLAPAAKDFTSKELFKNLGKSGLKTTVGEVGQLMSNYDDLMTKVAIDATAPGLRPAFKALKNKIADYTGVNAREDFVDVEMEPAVELIRHLEEAEKTIPETPEDIAKAADRLPSEIVRDSVENAPMNNLNYNIQKQSSKPTVDPTANPFASFRKRLNAYDRRKNKAFQESINEFQKIGKPVDLGIDRRQGYVTEDLEEIRNIIKERFLSDYYGLENIQTVKNANPTLPQDPFDSLGQLPKPSPTFQELADESFYRDAFNTFKNALSYNSDGSVNPVTFDTLKNALKYNNDGSIKLLEHFSNTTPDLSGVKAPELSVHPGYIDDIIDAISTDEGLKYALETGEWSKSGSESLNNLVNAVLSDPRYKDSLYYPKYNDQFTISPSELARLEIPGVSEDISEAYALLDKTRYLGGDILKPMFDSEEAFDAFMGSDNMYTALNAMFPPRAADAFSRSKYAVESADLQNTDWQAIRLNSFKKKLKAVMYPEEGTVQKAYSNLKDIGEFFDTNTSKIDADLASAVPLEFEFLQNLYNTTDEISTKFIDPLEGFGFDGNRDVRRLRYFDDTPKGLETSEKLNIDDYVKALFNTASRNIKHAETLERLFKPLKPYYQLKFKPDSVIRSQKASKTVDTFVQEVLPLVEEYTRKGGQIYSLKNSTFYPKYMKKESVDKLKSLLGFSDTPSKDSKAFLRLLNEVFVDPKYAPKSGELSDAINLVKAEGKLVINNGKPTAETVRAIREKLGLLGHPLGFTPSRDVSKYLETVDNTSIDYNALPHHLLSKIQSPNSVLKSLDAFPSLRASVDRSNAVGQLQDFAFSEYNRVVDSLRQRLPSLGFKSEEELEDLLKKMKTVPLYKLSAEEYRKLNVYASEYFKTVGQLPYYSVNRHVLDFKPDTGFLGIHTAIDSIPADAVRKRLKDMLHSEILTHLSNNNVSSPMFALQKDYDEFIDPILNRITRTGVHPGADEFEQAFLKEFDEAVSNGDFNKLDKIRKKYYAKARYTGHSTAFLKSFTDSLGWTARKSTLGFKYTDANVKYVRENLMPLLPNKISSAWRPSARNGLFYFDMHLGEKPDLIRIQENFDINPGNLQIWERSKMFSDAAIVNDAFFKNPKGYTTYLGYIDYSKIAPDRLNYLTKKLLDTEVKMDRLSKGNEPAKYETYKSILEKANVEDVSKEIPEALAKEAPDTIAKQAYVSDSVAESAAEKVVNEAVPDVAKFVEDGGSPEAAKKVFGPKKWSLFEQIQKARAIFRKNSFAKDRATLRTSIARVLGDAFTKITGKRPSRDFKAFYNIRQKMVGDSIKGSDFWTVFRRSGMLAAAYEEDSPMLKTLKASLDANAALINSNAGKDIVEVVEQKLSNGNVAVIMRWNGNKKTAKLVKDAQKKLDSAKFVDTVFTNPEKLTQQEQEFMASDDMVELSRLMEQLQAQASDQAKYLGFNFDNASPYTKHAMRHDPKTAEYLNSTFYTNVSSDDYDSISRIISDLDGYRQMDKGAFGTFLQERRFRGNYWNLESEAHPMFEYSPDRVFNSTLGDGIFANLQYQSFVDMFVNDNFKIKDWFKTPDDLKKVLYAKDSKGALSGNLQNLELVTFKTDANGRVIGLTKFDKMSDAGLEKALQDENTILVPANAVSHMDNLLRKDVRFGNKFWTFINKHFTIPFKFSLLSNPGFILGNMGDATFKLATTMSEKYGTSVAAEVQNVAESINTVVSLKNSYYKAFDDWIKTVDDKGIQISPEARIPEIVAMSPKYKESFLKYLDNSFKLESVNPITKVPESEMVFNNLLQEDIDGARVYMMLQDMQMSSSKLREFAELAELEHVSNFEVPYNLWDRIAQGSGKYKASKPSTWGLFMNNPIMKGFSDASGAWEDLIRSASIIDDLKHKRYRIEDLSEFSKTIVNDPLEYRRLTEVDLENAKNTMFNAQFDYERVNDFLDGVGKVMPFPIFFLKNFQYWMDLFMRNPQFVDNVIDVQEGLWSGYDNDDKFMKDAKGRGAIPVGGKSLPEWFKGVYKPSPMQSMFGAFNLLGDPINDLTYRVNPLIGGAATIASSALPDNELTTLLNDPENVKYRPYSTDIYERNVKIGDEKFDPMEYAVHRANPFERATNTYLRTPAKIKEGEFQLSDAFPSVFQPMF